MQHAKANSNPDFPTEETRNHSSGKPHVIDGEKNLHIIVSRNDTTLAFPVN
jgi:hypothetical protein